MQITLGEFKRLTAHLGDHTPLKDVHEEDIVLGVNEIDVQAGLRGQLAQEFRDRLEQNLGTLDALVENTILEVFGDK
jgi:hypothetical protein